MERGMHLMSQFIDGTTKSVSENCSGLLVLEDSILRTNNKGLGYQKPQSLLFVIYEWPSNPEIGRPEALQPAPV